jgi:hypothetical protein
VIAQQASYSNRSVTVIDYSKIQNDRPLLTPACARLTFNHAPAADADFSSHANYF